MMPTENDVIEIQEGSSVHDNLMNLLSASGMGVVVAAGENGRVISLNDAASSFLRKSSRDLMGLPSEEVMKDLYETGHKINRSLVEENGVVFQVFSFKVGPLGSGETDEDLQRIFRDLDDLYFKTTVEGTILSVSRSIFKFAGYTPGEVIGKSIKEFYKDPADRQILLSRLSEEEKLSEYELELVKRNGETIYTMGSIHLLRNEKGEPEFIEGMLTDVTGRKLLEERVINNSEFFRQVVESVPDAVVTIDCLGKVTGWNREAVNLFGWTPEEALGKPLDDLVGTESGKNEIRSQEIIDGRVIRGQECTRHGKTAVEKRVFVSVAPIVMGKDILGAVGVYTDLSDRETILEKLRENEVKFRSITDSAQDAVIIMDDDGYISFFNTSAERMFGYHRTETAGKKLHELIAPEAYREMFEMGFREFRKTGQGIMVGRVVEMEGRRKDGTIFPVELSVSSFHMNGSWHATGILRDITERKKIELELIDAREGALNAVRTKSEFLANMSHEIRTPLNAIIGTTDLLWETQLDRRQQNYLRVCRNAGENLLALINDILDISKVEAGRIELENIQFNLYENTEKTCETLALRAHEKGLELNCRILPDTPEWVTGDPARLRQILTNLIGNAVKFTESGEVTVEVKSGADGIIVFSVKDTGIGIPEGKLESIFMSFTQADSSHTRRFGGTGLGLTISRKLVELMDGKMTVKSELGRGSVFSFSCSLPASASAGEHGAASESIEGKRILVVDDNSNNRMILSEILTAWKADVDTASGGMEAIDRVKSRGYYDVIVLDCMMPDISGFETAALMQHEGLVTGTVVMMLTSDGSGTYTEKCRNSGIQHFMVKPVRREDLKEQIIGALNGLKKTDSPDPESTIRGIETRELNVLLAEDSPDNRFLILKYTENYPWKVAVAENGKEAVELFRTQSFDVVLMDMQMPVMDGYEATRAIRVHEHNSRSTHTPVVALTAHAMKEEIRKCIEAGCDIHISKPVRKKNLIKELDDLLNATGAMEGPPNLSDSSPVAQVPVDLEPLIAGYIENRRRDLISIAGFVETGNFDEARRLSHSMKGSGGGYGFDRISEIGAEMEKAAKENNGPAIIAGLQQLREYIDTVKIEYVEEE